jgi:UTP--glucose-1-phosphate uridylyltransferase
MADPLTKAVIPAAGLGTRFLPVTKRVPKELLPIVDTPSIQYVIEEAVRAGLGDVLVVTAPGKEAIEEHFAPDPDLEAFLAARDKGDLLERVQALSGLADLHFALQSEPRGLGHAIGVAREHVAGEPFAVLLADDLMVDDAALLRRMLAVHADHGGVVLALMEVEASQIAAYGCAAVEPVAADAEPDDGVADVVRVLATVEKPRPDDAPSNLAVIGRYVFPPEIFGALDRTAPGVGGEIQITDAIGSLVGKVPVHGVVFREGRFDAGDKVDFLRANLEFALAREDIGAEVARVVADVARRHGLV